MALGDGRPPHIVASGDPSPTPIMGSLSATGRVDVLPPVNERNDPTPRREDANIFWIVLRTVKCVASALDARGVPRVHCKNETNEITFAGQE